MWKAVKAGKRTADGGYDLNVKCACGRNNTVLVENDEIVDEGGCTIRICKSCASEIIEEIDKFYWQLYREGDCDV